MIKHGVRLVTIVAVLAGCAPPAQKQYYSALSFQGSEECRPLILDTGATDLVIPADVALTVIRAGALTSGDFRGKGRYSLANASEEVSDRVIIREVQIGRHTVRNVTPMVNPPASDILQG
jgi:hypothetical protein